MRRKKGYTEHIVEYILTQDENDGSRVGERFYARLDEESYARLLAAQEMDVVQIRKHWVESDDPEAMDMFGVKEPSAR